MKSVFVKIQLQRYRLTTIKMYEPFENENGFGIYVYFSISNRSDRRYHLFDSKRSRNISINKLDELFNVKYYEKR